MYLFREFQILPLFLIVLLWGTGGWLMTIRWFDLEPHERGLIGFGMGMMIANWMGNFLARFLPMPVVFWVAGLLTLAVGLLAAWPLNRALFVAQPKVQWSRWLLFIALAFIFTRSEEHTSELQSRLNF